MKKKNFTQPEDIRREICMSYFQLVKLLIFVDMGAVLKYKEKKCYAKVDSWIPNQPQHSFASPFAKPMSELCLFTRQCPCLCCTCCI